MISVLIPVYNVAAFLRECLDSVIAQSYRNLEIICIDDGSTDDSPKILQEYAAKDERIIIISQENKGYGSAMNAGLDRATGDYISIVESDDFISPDMIEKLYAWAEDSRTDFVKTDYYRYKNGEDTYTVLYSNPLYDQVFSGCSQKPDFLFAGGNIWAGLYRRDFLTGNGIRFAETQGASYQDTSFNYKVFACAKRILIKNQAFYHYRTDNIASSVNSHDKVYCLCDEMDEIERFSENREDMKDVAKHWLAVYRFFCYKWNYERINDRYKMEFLEKWHHDTVSDLQHDAIHKEDWPDYLWNILSCILISREEYYFKGMYSPDIGEFIGKGFRQEISEYNSCYVYGAGRIAEKVMTLLTRLGIMPGAVLVKDTGCNPEEFHGIRVKDFRDTDIEKSHAVVLVALGQKNAWQALKELQPVGFERIILMSNELIQALQG